MKTMKLTISAAAAALFLVKGSTVSSFRGDGECLEEQLQGIEIPVRNIPYIVVIEPQHADDTLAEGDGHRTHDRFVLGKPGGSLILSSFIIVHHSPIKQCSFFFKR